MTPRQTLSQYSTRETTALLFVVLLLWGPTASAYVGLCCGKCGGNMPMNIPGGGVPETWEFRFKVSPMLMHMEGLRDGTDAIDIDSILGMPAAGKYMAAPLSMDMRMLNLTVGYSFSDDFFAGIMAMWKDNHMDMKFNAAMQTLTGLSGYTMESDGLADIMLMAKYRLFANDPLMPTRQASLFLGLSIPTGSIDERNTTHPLAMRQTELLPYGMQLGSGTFDPAIGILYQASRSPWWWGINAMYTARIEDNDRGYRLGNETRIDFYSMYQIRHDFLWQAQLNLHHQGRIRGEADEALTGASGHAVQGDPASPYMSPLWDPNNYGGTQAFATFGIQWQPAPLHVVDAQFSLPLYRDLNGPQLETDYRIMLTWFYELPTRRSVRYTGSDAPAPSRLGF